MHGAKNTKKYKLSVICQLPQVIHRDPTLPKHTQTQLKNEKPT